PASDLLSSPEVQAALAKLPTERARADYRASNTLCRSCHEGRDGLGLLLEHYGPIGRYRGGDGGHTGHATLSAGRARRAWTRWGCCSSITIRSAATGSATTAARWTPPP